MKKGTSPCSGTKIKWGVGMENTRGTTDTKAATALLEDHSMTLLGRRQE